MRFQNIKITLFALLIIIFISLPLPVNAQSDDDWPTFQQNPQHTGFNSVETILKPPLSLIWKFPIKQANIITSGNLLYANSNDASTNSGVIYALDLSTGQIKWQSNTHGGSALAVSGNTLFVGEINSNCFNICKVTAYDSTTGDIKWSSDPINGGVVGLNISDDKVFIGSHSWQLQALDINSGKTQWITHLSDGAPSTPALYNGIAYIGSYNNGGLYAIESSSGQIKWNYPFINIHNSSPTIANGTLYIGSSNGVHAFDPLTGYHKWNVLQGISINSTISVANNLIYVLADNGQVYALNDSGSIIWKYEPQLQNPGSSIAIANGIVYVGEGNDLIALNSVSGEHLWSNSNGGKIYYQLIANGKLFFYSQDGYINAFETLLAPPCTLPGFGDTNGNPLRQEDPRWDNLPYGGGYYKKSNGERVFLPFIWYGNNKDTIGNWGCKLTSAAMIINYFAKMQEVIDPTTNEIFQTNPLILNSWLQQQENGKGYYNGKALPINNPTHWDSAGVALEAIVKYAKDNGVNISSDGRLFQKKDKNRKPLETISQFIDRTKGDINESMCKLNPVILGVKNSGHFIDATGNIISEATETWRIHDPLWNGISSGISTLKAKYNNIYNQIDLISGKIPNRHLVVTKYSPIEMYITDPLRNKIGLDASTNTLYENPPASYGLEYLGAKDTNGGLLEYGILDIPNPVNGDFILAVIGTGTGTYGLEIRGTDEDANISSLKISGITIPGKSEIYHIRYNKDLLNTLNLNKEITFKTLKDDLQASFDNGFIDNQGTLNSLLNKVDQAIKSQNKNSQKDILNSFTNELNAQRNKHLKEESYQILIIDIDFLIKNL